MSCEINMPQEMSTAWCKLAAQQHGTARPRPLTLTALHSKSLVTLHSITPVAIIVLLLLLRCAHPGILQASCWSHEAIFPGSCEYRWAFWKTAGHPPFLQCFRRPHKLPEGFLKHHKEGMHNMENHAGGLGKKAWCNQQPSPIELQQQQEEDG